MKPKDKVTHPSYPGEELTIKRVIGNIATIQLPDHLKTTHAFGRVRDSFICDTKLLTPVVEKPKEVEDNQQILFL